MPGSFDQPADDAPRPEPLTLGPADAAALDALVDSAMRAPEGDARAENLHRLLSALSPDPKVCAADPSLVDATVARALRARRGAPGEARHAGALLGEDGAALDALVACEWDEAALPARHARRGRRMARLLDALRPLSSEAAGDADLIERTLARVSSRAGAPSKAAAQPWMDRVSLPAPAGGFRLSDLVAVAAMLLVGLSILWPTIGAARQGAIRAACETGLANAGVGFALYANDNQGRLPAVEGSIPAALPGASAWWEVGSPSRSHSANLFVLIKQGYVSQQDLACAGNPDAPVHLHLDEHDDWRRAEEVSYSFQLYAGPARRMPDNPEAVLLSDRSPLVIRGMLHESARPESRSPNHNGAGQNVLFADRSVRWLVRPVTPGGDNIWLPANLTGTDGPVQLQGTETPDGPDDAFVGP